MNSRSLLLLSSMFLLAACGGKSIDPGDGGDTDGGNTDGDPPGPKCPASAPKAGASCNIDGIECEYGSDVRSVCNTISRCISGSWAYALDDQLGCPTPANDPTCPASPAQATGDCSDMGLSCNYSTSSQTRFCTCNYLGGPPMEDGGFQPSWECSFGTTTGCPSARPKIGATCSQPDLDCSYDVCGVPQGLSFQCSAETGTWVEGFGDVCAGAN